MRYLVGSMCVLALLISPLSASAQASEGGATSEPSLRESSSEQAPEEPALRLELDDDSVKLAPSPRRTALEERMELRVGVKGAKIGLYVSVGVFVVGSLVFAAGATGDCFLTDTPPERCDPLVIAGYTLMGGGGVGMIISGTLLGVRKRKLRRWDFTHYGTPRRVQWDLARSRLVF